LGLGLGQGQGIKSEGGSRFPVFSLRATKRFEVLLKSNLKSKRRAPNFDSVSAAEAAANFPLNNRWSAIDCLETTGTLDHFHTAENWPKK
jgi:hypothetical protein